MLNEHLYFRRILACSLCIYLLLMRYLCMCIMGRSTEAETLNSYEIILNKRSLLGVY